MSDVKNSKMKDWFALTGNNIKEGASKAWNATKSGASNLLNYGAAHPFMTAGLGLTGAANLGGLFDNDKIGGQLIGGALGGAAGHWLLPKLIGSAVPAQYQVLAGLGGGTLGALFDKLRQNKEDQYDMQMRQGGMY